jgi:hypothetical protein
MKKLQQQMVSFARKYDSLESQMTDGYRRGLDAYRTAFDTLKTSFVKTLKPGHLTEMSTKKRNGKPA